MEDLLEPLVSAIITTHNRPLVLSRAINSVLQQSYKNIEILVVDDGSSQETEKVIREIQVQHPSIQYFKHEIPKGACAARNLGIRNSIGKFVTGLDDDDEWMPNRIESFVNAYDNNFAMLSALNICVDGTGTSFIPDKRPNSTVITLDDMLYENVLGNQVFVLRERMLGIQGFDESLCAAQDYDTWLRLILKYGNAKSLDVPLQKVYVGTELNRITDSSNKFLGYLNCYKKHKQHFSNRQRKYQLFSMYKSRGKPISWKTLLKLNIRGYRKEIFKYYFMHSKFKDVLKEWVRRSGFRR